MVFLGAILAPPAFAQIQQPESVEFTLFQQSEQPTIDSDTPTEDSPTNAEDGESEEDDGDEPASFYVEPRSTGTRRETEPPRYVRNLSELKFFNRPDETWLDIGLDYRMRYEYRDDDLRRPVQVLDEPFLMRTRGYLGVREILDPFRCYFEYEDARRYNSQFPIDNRDWNENEIIQWVGELYFDDAVAGDRPLRFQYGRMAFEYTDRRLIARNEWRNTTNNFRGFRAIAGEQDNDWQIDFLALQPLLRLPRQFDEVDEDIWFYGLVGDWRRWSDVITLQPYYLVLNQRESPTRIDREIHTMALRGYGIVGDTGYDYDFDVAFQFGHHGIAVHRALGFTTELGYTFEHKSNPRISAFMGYGSGDHDPNDNRNQRFDRLFGFARPWSANDYFLWENLIAPKARFEFQPHERVRVDGGYGVFWLASDTDSWANAELRDPTGQSGDFIGHEFDVRIRYTWSPRVDLTFGYAHFIPGEFPSNLGKGEDSDFFYVEIASRFFN